MNTIIQWCTQYTEYNKWYILNTKTESLEFRMGSKTGINHHKIVHQRITGSHKELKVVCTPTNRV